MKRKETKILQNDKGYGKLDLKENRRDDIPLAMLI
jgi:hypothetical protein